MVEVVLGCDGNAEKFKLTIKDETYVLDSDRLWTTRVGMTDFRIEYNQQKRIVTVSRPDRQKMNQADLDELTETMFISPAD